MWLTSVIQRRFATVGAGSGVVPRGNVPCRRVYQFSYDGLDLPARPRIGWSEQAFTLQLREVLMSKFCFSVSNIDSRRDGEIESDSFSDAVDELGRQIVVSKGDLLEIGVYGFPPARYECVGLMKGTRPIWFPTGGRMAA